MRRELTRQAENSPNRLTGRVDGTQPGSIDVDVWRADLDAPPAATVGWLESLLAGDERRRAEQFYFERDRKRFVVCRGILRLVLARYVSRAPEELVLTYGPNGKPRLADQEVYFNVAHSDGLALIAVTRAGEVGVDVERVRELPDCAQVAQAAFSPRELAKLQACPADQWQAEFFRAWVRQEAILKAHGTGLGAVPNEEAHRGFAVYPIKLDDGYVAALAVAKFATAMTRGAAGRQDQTGIAHSTETDFS